MTRIRDEVFGAIRWDTLGRLLTSGLTFATTVWLVRYLGPERYGLLAALLAALGLVQLFVGSGLRDAVLRFVPGPGRERDPAALGALVRRALIARVVVLVVVGLGCWVARDTVARVGLGRHDVARYVWFIPPLVILPVYVGTISASLIAVFRQRSVRVAEVLNKAVFAAALLSLPLWADPLVGVFAAWLVGWLVAAVCLTLDPSVRRLLTASARSARVTPGRWMRFSSAAYALALVGFVLGRQLDLLLLAWFGTPPADIASYAVVFSFVWTALSLPLLPIGGGFELPLVARLHARGDREGLQRYFRAFFEYVYVFVLPIVGGGLVIGPALVAAIYGPRYADAMPVLAPLLVVLGLGQVAGITGPILLASDREVASLAIRGTMAAVNVVLGLGAIPAFGIVGAAWATSVAMVGIVVGEAIVVRRTFRPAYPWAFLARIAIATGGAMVVLGAGRLLAGPQPGLLAVLAIVALGALAYLGGLLSLRPLAGEHAEMIGALGNPTITALLRRLSRDASPAAPDVATR